MSAVVSIYVYHHKPSCQSRLYRVTQLRTDGVHCRESVHCCTAAEHTVDPFFLPDLCLYKRRKLSVHGTVSYVVFQNIPGYDVLLLCILWTGFYPPPTYACQRVKKLLYTVQYHMLCFKT